MVLLVYSHLQIVLFFRLLPLSISAGVKKKNFRVESWQPCLFLSKNITDQEKHCCQFFYPALRQPFWISKGPPFCNI